MTQGVPLPGISAPGRFLSCRPLLMVKASSSSSVMGSVHCCNNWKKQFTPVVGNKPQHGLFFQIIYLMISIWFDLKQLHSTSKTILNISKHMTIYVYVLNLIYTLNCPCSFAPLFWCMYSESCRPWLAPMRGWVCALVRGASTGTAPITFANEKWLIQNLLEFLVKITFDKRAKIPLHWHICKNFESICKCTVPQTFKLRPKRYIYFDLVKACEGVFLLCFLGQIVTWQLNPNLLD